MVVVNCSNFFLLSLFFSRRSSLILLSCIIDPFFFVHYPHRIQLLSSEFSNPSVVCSLSSITLRYLYDSVFGYLPSLLIDAHEDGKEGFNDLVPSEARLFEKLTCKIPPLFLEYRFSFFKSSYILLAFYQMSEAIRFSYISIDLRT